MAWTRRTIMGQQVEDRRANVPWYAFANVRAAGYNGRPNLLCCGGLLVSPNLDASAFANAICARLLLPRPQVLQVEGRETFD